MPPENERHTDGDLETRGELAEPHGDTPSVRRSGKHSGASRPRGKVGSGSNRHGSDEPKTRGRHERPRGATRSEVCHRTPRPGLRLSEPPRRLRGRKRNFAWRRERTKMRNEEGLVHAENCTAAS